MAVNENKKVIVEKLARSKRLGLFGKRPPLKDTFSSEDATRKRDASDAKIKQLLADVKASHKKIFGS